MAGLATLPAYDEDVDGRLAAPAVAAACGATLAAADAVLIATPEYNASIPGALKNALDWASRPFPDNCLRGKPVAVIGASTGLFGAVWAQAELRKVLKTIGAAVARRGARRCPPRRRRSHRTAASRPGAGGGASSVSCTTLIDRTRDASPRD